MIKKFWKEIVIAAVLTAVVFVAFDVGADLLMSVPEDLVLSVEIMFLSIAILVVPGLVGGIVSGFLVGKKTKDIKAILFIPAIGAAIGSAGVMLLSLGEVLFLTDAGWQAQLTELSELGVGFFAEMSLPEYKTMIIASVIFGMFFMALINFAVGLLGGFVGNKVAGKK